MNAPLARRDLESALAERGSGAYVVTVSEIGTPHVVQAQVALEGDRLTTVVGTHTADNARRRPRVSLLFPSRTGDDYSLIVDAVATVDVTEHGPRLLLVPTRAVLHRPGPAPQPATSACGSDCVPLAFRRPGPTGSA